MGKFKSIFKQILLEEQQLNYFTMPDKVISYIGSRFKIYNLESRPTKKTIKNTKARISVANNEDLSPEELSKQFENAEKEYIIPKGVFVFNSDDTNELISKFSSNQHTTSINKYWKAEKASSKINLSKDPNYLSSIVNLVNIIDFNASNIKKYNFIMANYGGSNIKEFMTHMKFTKEEDFNKKYVIIEPIKDEYSNIDFIIGRRRSLKDSDGITAAYYINKSPINNFKYFIISKAPKDPNVKVGDDIKTFNIFDMIVLTTKDAEKINEDFRNVSEQFLFVQSSLMQPNWFESNVPVEKIKSDFNSEQEIIDFIYNNEVKTEQVRENVNNLKDLYKTLKENIKIVVGEDDQVEDIIEEEDENHEEEIINNDEQVKLAREKEKTKQKEAEVERELAKKETEKIKKQKPDKKEPSNVLDKDLIGFLKQDWYIIGPVYIPNKEAQALLKNCDQKVMGSLKDIIKQKISKTKDTGKSIGRELLGLNAPKISPGDDPIGAVLKNKL